MRFSYRPLTKEELEQTRKVRMKMIEKFRQTSKEGQIVGYLGKEFIVYPNVFWPHHDSRPLVENYRIEPGEMVLDVGTGSGVIAVFSALKGAGKVVAVDINPEAVRTAKENAKRHGFSSIVEVKESDVYDSLDPGERFDVITANLPFTLKEDKPKDIAERAVYDEAIETNSMFIAGLKDRLKESGRAYISQANFGSVDKVLEMAMNEGISIEHIGTREMGEGDSRVFFAFELILKE